MQHRGGVVGCACHVRRRQRRWRLQPDAHRGRVSAAAGVHQRRRQRRGPPSPLSATSSHNFLHHPRRPLATHAVLLDRRDLAAMGILDSSGTVWRGAAAQGGRQASSSTRLRLLLWTPRCLAPLKERRGPSRLSRVMPFGLAASARATLVVCQPAPYTGGGSAGCVDGHLVVPVSCTTASLSGCVWRESACVRREVEGGLGTP